MVIRFPTVPLTVNEDTVVVDPPTSFKVWGGVSILKLLNVKLPIIWYVPVPPPVNQILLKVFVAKPVVVPSRSIKIDFL